MNYDYVINAPISVKQIADLREAVGWNRMESCYENKLMTSYFHISGVTYAKCLKKRIL
ncbi:MAG TPA: hypothetical protein GXX20_10955 [Clostridiaceae bacterium]|nr:hypothetical protein [Clostridiaceae bacterium]